MRPFAQLAFLLVLYPQPLMYRRGMFVNWFGSYDILKSREQYSIAWPISMSKVWRKNALEWVVVLIIYFDF